NANGNVGLTAEEHQRFRVAAVFEEVHQLWVQPGAAALEIVVELRHLVGDDLPISGLDASEEGDKRCFDLHFHGGAALLLIRLLPTLSPIAIPGHVRAGLVSAGFAWSIDRSLSAQPTVRAGAGNTSSGGWISRSNLFMNRSSLPTS